MPKIEIACFNLESAVIAEQNGANRVELCDQIDVGGTTPSVSLVADALAKLSIDFYVMIRPRGGNFCYTEQEFETMKHSIGTLKAMGVNGFVFGVLTPSGNLNIHANKELIALSAPYPCTLHRAFDNTNNIFETLEQAIDCGFSTILCSGGASNVNLGKLNLQKLVAQAKNRITIMPGGGLRSSNLYEIAKVTQAQFYHSSAITDPDSTTANPAEVTLLSQIVAEEI